MRNIVCIALIALCFNVQAQKKELRKIDKLVLESFWEEAKDELETSKSLILSSEDKYKAQYYFYDARVSNELAVLNNELKVFKNAISSLNELNKLNPTSILPSKLQLDFSNLTTNIANSLVNSAVKDNQVEKYLDASEKLFTAYEMDKEKNIDWLYFAAESSVSAQDLDTALGYYLILQEIGYTGVRDEYFITDNITGVEQKVSSIAEYELLKAQKKDYSNPRIGQTESRLPGIVKNIAMIYVKRGEIEIAENAIKEARMMQPNDLGLLLTEGNVYLRISNESKDESERELYVEKFKSVMEAAVKMDPENGLLYYNLGIIFSDQNDLVSAEEYFRKAIQFKYNRGYFALAEIILMEEKSLVEEMNSLGNSKADDLRYSELLKMKEDVYYKVIPLLKESLVSEPNDLLVLRLLKNIYAQLSNNEEFVKYRSIIEELENK